MDNRAWVNIDLDRLRQNVRALRMDLQTITPNPQYKTREVKILAVVKANAYGHGAKEISKTLKDEGVEMLGVATLDEAYELKEIGLPIIILLHTPQENIPIIVKENFIPTIIDYRFATELNKEAYYQNKRLKVHIWIYTGLLTAGVNWEEGVEFVSQLSEFKDLEIEGVFTHFSESDDKDSGFTELQIKRFNTVLNGISATGLKNIPLVHTSASDGILNFLKNSHFATVRPGILLYGLYPGAQCDKRIEVEPILTWQTRVCRVNNVPKGVGIGYRRTYITDREQKIATLLIGYGDGYPRNLSNKGYVIIRGRKAKIVGTVCMDLTVVDVTNIPEVKIGDTATLIGKNGDISITAEDVAALAGTINYEITTRIGPRVARVYIQDSEQ